MKQIIKLFKRIMIFIIGLIIVLAVGIAIFINVAPQFGQVPQGEDLERVKKSEHFEDGVFVNLIETKMDIPLSKIPGMMWGFLSPGENKSPSKSLPTEFNHQANTAPDSTALITWYGHSAVLLKIDGKVILIDPMLGPAASPVSFMTNRFNYEEPIDLKEIPKVDAIIISHDHYDHLDYPSIVELKDKTDHFFTALGVGSHLEKWGVDKEAITELDWWQDVEYQGLKFTAAPARHFSGRGILDRNKTQWASWAVQGKKQNIYFSGDGGYGPHFKEIGEKLGPFDFAMMECGQYNKMWEAIHMMPEQSVQAGIDVQGKILMPIHWGAFDLSLHTWTDPVQRFTKEAKRLKVEYTTPVIGKEFNVAVQQPQQYWWE